MAPSEAVCQNAHYGDGLAAKMIEQPEEQREGQAEHEASDDREVEGRVLASMDNVTGKTAEAEWQAPSKIKECTNQDDQGTSNEESTAEFAHGIHGCN